MWKFCDLNQECWAPGMEGPSNLQLADSKESSPRPLQGPGHELSGQRDSKKKGKRHVNPGLPVQRTWHSSLPAWSEGHHVPCLVASTALNFLCLWQIFWSWSSGGLEGSGTGPQDKGPSHQGNEQMWEGQGCDYVLWKSVFPQSLPALSLRPAEPETRQSPGGWLTWADVTV